MRPTPTPGLAVAVLFLTERTLARLALRVRDSLRTSRVPGPLPTSAAAIGSPDGASALSSLLSNLATSAGPPAAASSTSSSRSQPPPSYALAPFAASSSTSDAVQVSSSSASTPATNPSLVVPAATTTTTTDGSLSFNEILTRLQSPAVLPAVPVSAGTAGSQPHPAQVPFPHSPPRQQSHHFQQPQQPPRSSPGPFHVGPSGGQTPTSFYPYPLHQLHHQHHQQAHSSPVHTFAHNPATTGGRPGPGSPSGSPYLRHAAPQHSQPPPPPPPSFGFASHQPHPSSPFAQRTAASTGPSHPHMYGPGPPPPPPPFNIGPNPHNHQQQASPSRPALGSGPGSFPPPSTTTTPSAAANLPRGTQLLDQMFNSLAPAPVTAQGR